MNAVSQHLLNAELYIAGRTKGNYKKNHTPNLCPHDSYTLIDNLGCTGRWTKIDYSRDKNLSLP